MATRDERPATRRQVGEACVLGGVGALIGTPIVYRIRASTAHVRLARNWLWPTWWMLIPLVVALIGAALVLLPPSFDLRRSLLRGRAAARRRRR